MARDSEGLVMGDSKNSFLAMTKGQRASVPFLILWPILSFYIAIEYPDAIAMMGGLAWFVYFFLGLATGYTWPCMLALIGSAIGLGFQPAVFGGSMESRIWQCTGCYSTGAAIGLVLGLCLKHMGIKNPDIHFPFRARRNT